MPSDSIDQHASDISVTTESIHRLDPIKFPLVHSLDKEPFFEVSSTGGMQYFNPPFVFLWFHGSIKTVNMYPFLVPSHEESMAVLFACKIPNVDCTPSEGTPFEDLFWEMDIQMDKILIHGSYLELQDTSG